MSSPSAASRALTASFKQLEYACCSFITLATRAAVEGGLDADTAYSISDVYLQRLVKCLTPAEILMLHCHRNCAQPWRSQTWPPPQMRYMGPELSLGFPSLFGQVSSGIVIITFNAIILALNGNTGVAAYGVIANISLVIVALYTGIAQGAQPLLSRFYGAGDQRQVRKVLHYAIMTVLPLSCMVYLGIYLFAGPVTAIFNNERDPSLQQIAVTGLKLYFISNPFVGYNIILTNDPHCPLHVPDYENQRYPIRNDFNGTV